MLMELLDAFVTECLQSRTIPLPEYEEPAFIHVSLSIRVRVHAFMCFSLRRGWTNIRRSLITISAGSVCARSRRVIYCGQLWYAAARAHTRFAIELARDSLAPDSHSFACTARRLASRLLPTMGRQGTSGSARPSRPPLSQVLPETGGVHQQDGHWPSRG